MRKYLLGSILGFALSTLAWAGEILASTYKLTSSMYDRMVDMFIKACYSMPIQTKSEFGLGKANTIGRTWEPKETANHRGNKDISFGVHIHSNSLCM